MNIFAISDSPLDCASYLDSRRLAKMIVETAQLLGTAVREFAKPGDDLTGVYKATHRNHPCSLWVRESRGNFNWTIQLGVALAVEWSFRNEGRKHRSLEAIIAAARHVGLIPPGERTEFVNCTTFPNEPDVRLAYMRHLSAKWYEEMRSGRKTKFGPAGVPRFYMLEWPLPNLKKETAA